MTQSVDNHPILLASSSQFRRELLQQIISEFDCFSPDIDETPLANESPEALALRLSQQKAEAALQKYPHHIIIAGDQTASCKGKQLSKPLTETKAVEQLSFCNGEEVVFHSGLCVKTQTQETLLSIPFTVQFRHLSHTEIENYVKLDQPLWSAGAFKLESLGICLFEALRGEDYSALIGLPLLTLSKVLRDFGVNPLLKGIH